MADRADLVALVRAIAAGDLRLARAMLDATPSLATEHLARRDEFFVPECHAQVYERDTALHAAAFAYDSELARELVARGADVRLAIGGEPSHCMQR